MTKFLDKLRPTMLDPSLINRDRFWWSTDRLREIFSTVYVPMSIRMIRDNELREFYTYYLHKEEVLSVEEIVNKSERRFRWFSYEEYLHRIPSQFAESFERLQHRLRKSRLPLAVSNILLDEFVFLTVHSSILSRLKKTFKLLESFGDIPLINLEKRVPPEWQGPIRSIKRAVDLVNWISIIAQFKLSLGPIEQFSIEGIRLLLIDPQFDSARYELI